MWLSLKGYMAVGRNVLKLEGIEKTFGKVHALRGIDLSVDMGEVVGLIGDNGAGKSTLIKILCGLYCPDKGKIYWKGKEVRIESVKCAREMGIETVHEGGLTIGILSVSDNVFLTREIKKSVGPFKTIDKRRQNEIAARLTASLGLAIDSPKQEVRLCSGGEKQGVAIARALQFNAELLILDEPTRGLAPSGRRKVVDFVKKVKERDLACIYAEPDIYLAAEVADKFVVIVQGEVVGVIEKKTGLDLEEVEALMRIRNQHGPNVDIL